MKYAVLLSCVYCLLEFQKIVNIACKLHVKYLIRGRIMLRDLFIYNFTFSIFNLTELTYNAFYIRFCY